MHLQAEYTYLSKALAHIQYISSGYGSSSYMKVIWWSYSTKDWKYLFTQCKTSECAECGPWAVVCPALSMDLLVCVCVWRSSTRSAWWWWQGRWFRPLSVLMVQTAVTLDASACCILLIMGGLHKHWNTGGGHVRWRVINVCSARAGFNVCSTRHVLTMVMRQSTVAKQMSAALSIAQPRKSFQPCLTHCHWLISSKCYCIQYAVYVDNAVQMLNWLDVGCSSIIYQYKLCCVSLHVWRKCICRHLLLYFALEIAHCFFLQMKCGICHSEIDLLVVMWRAAGSCCWIGLAPSASAASLSLFRGDLSSTVNRSLIVRFLGTMQGQTPHDGSWVLSGVG